MDDRTRHVIEAYFEAMDELYDIEPVVIDARTGRVVTAD